MEVFEIFIKIIVIFYKKWSKKHHIQKHLFIKSVITIVFNFGTGFDDNFRANAWPVSWIAEWRSGNYASVPHRVFVVNGTDKKIHITTSSRANEVEEIQKSHGRSGRKPLFEIKDGRNQCIWRIDKKLSGYDLNISYYNNNTRGDDP